MEDMKEDKMNVLTQKEFDEEIIKALRNNMLFIEFMNVIVKDIKIKLIGRAQITIRFHNCRIESIFCDDLAWRHMLFGMEFYNCNIVNYEKVDFIRKACASGCTFIKPFPFVCPKEGEFVGYKKCCYVGDYCICICIVKLLIPEDAKRSSAFSNKCRCSKAIVIGIFDLDGNELEDIDEAFSDYDRTFTYEVGKEVYPDSFDDDRFEECSHGIHFFMTFKEAKDF